jgi:hypothetical protein
MDMYWLGHIPSWYRGSGPPSTPSLVNTPLSIDWSQWTCNRSSSNLYHQNNITDYGHPPSSKLQVIGDLSEARLYLHALPSSLKTRNEYRAERDVLPPKWTTLNISTLRSCRWAPRGKCWNIFASSLMISMPMVVDEPRAPIYGKGPYVCTRHVCNVEQFSRRWKFMLGLRRTYADSTILNQQANSTKNIKNGSPSFALSYRK